MIGSLMVPPCEAALPNPWRKWVDHVMYKRSEFRVQRAAVAYRTGSTAAASKNFLLPASEIKKLNGYFNVGSLESSPIRLEGKTYIVKRVSENQIVAFNGNKYLIVSKANHMFIITICKLRIKSQDGAVEWLGSLSDLLAEKGY